MLYFHLMQSITVHQDVLFREAWEEPMSILAKRYNISDVALAKICRKLKVPAPSRGYWAKIRNGHRMNKPKLPSFLLERWKLRGSHPSCSVPGPCLSLFKSSGCSRQLPKIVSPRRILAGDCIHSSIQPGRFLRAKLLQMIGRVVSIFVSVTARIGLEVA